MEGSRNIVEVEAYDKEYLSENTLDGVHAYEIAWNNLIARKPFFYIENLTPITHYDRKDRNPRLWNANQLQNASKIIEKRTREALELQKNILINWKKGAIAFQKIWRGYAARKIYFRLRMNVSRQRLEGHYYKVFRLLRIRQSTSIKIIQRQIRKFLIRCREMHEAACVLQLVFKQFIKRLKMYEASKKIVSWYSGIIYGRRLFQSIQQLLKANQELKRRKLAEEAINHFLHVQEKQRILRQNTYFHLNPDVVILNHLVKERKRERFQLKKTGIRNIKNSVYRRKLQAMMKMDSSLDLVDTIFRRKARGPVVLEPMDIPRASNSHAAVSGSLKRHDIFLQKR